MEISSEQNNLIRFGELVLANPSLQTQLRATPDQPAFIELALQLAAENDCPLTATGLQVAINQKRREWLERWI